MFRSPSLWALVPVALLSLFLTPPTSSAPAPVVDGCSGCVPLGEDPIFDAIWYENGSHIFLAGFPTPGFCMSTLNGDMQIICMGDHCNTVIEANVFNMDGYVQIWECGFYTEGDMRANCKQPPAELDIWGAYQNFEEYQIDCGRRMKFWMLLDTLEMSFFIECSACNY